MVDRPKRVIHIAIVSSDKQAGEDKASIPDQLARQRLRSQVNGWEVIDEIIVDCSRRFYTYLEYAAFAMKKGEPAPMRMFMHWDKADFDILSCRDLSRLGREQSILAEVVTRTIDKNAVIAPLDDALVDRKNYRMTNAIAGLSASQHIDNLILYKEIGKSSNVARGIKPGGKAPRFFVEIVDPKTHKPIGLKPDRERYQRFFDDLVIAYCDERIAYIRLGQYMYERFGHIDPKTGKPYDKQVFYYFMFNPATWGHSVWGRRRKHNRNGMDVTWAYWITGDEPPPETVKFFHNTIEPVWSSPTLERMKAEFKHRHFVMKGRMGSRTQYLFSGLLLCDTCGSTFSGCNQDGYYYYRCTGRFGAHSNQCENKRYIRQEVIIDWLTTKLEEVIDSVENVTFTEKVMSTTDRIASINNEITELENKIEALGNNLGIGETSNRIFKKQIKEIEDQIEILKLQQLMTYTETIAAEHRQVDRQQAIKEIKEIGIGKFWGQPTFTVNQWLHRYLDKTRIIIGDREVIDFVTPSSTEG